VKLNAAIASSLGAVGSALASMACCLPLGAAAALGLAGSGVFLDRVRPWFSALSVLLLAAGFWQQRRARHCGLRAGIVGVVLLWTSLIFVAAVILFPQEIAAVLAGPSPASHP